VYTGEIMSADFITHLILQYRYWILVPLSFIEGPVIAFIAGTLASVGFFSFPFLCLLFFVRDVGLDLAYYAAGYFGGHSGFTRRMLTKIGVTDDHLEQVRELWVRRPGMTMLIGKLSYGIASAFIVVAGVVKMPLRIFLTYGILVAILEYGTLLFAGYFLGASLGGSVTRIINNVQYGVAGFAIVLTAYYFVSRSMRRKFLKKEEEINDTQA
jgi:membrane protein DedA with SNARE-associated domain